MIYTLIYFICFDILILLTFLVFCLSDFIDNCKSPLDNISETVLSVYNNKVSSQYSPDRKSPSFSNSRLRRPLLKCRKEAVAKLN